MTETPVMILAGRTTKRPPIPPESRVGRPAACFTVNARHGVVAAELSATAACAREPKAPSRAGA